MKLNFLPSMINWSRSSTLVLLAMFLVNFSVFAQDVRISGKVSDETGAGLPGATVLVKGTNNGVVTDVNGDYAISAPGDGTLVFSFVGYDAQEAAINNRTSIDATLNPSIQSLEELVVVGYGEQKKVTVTGAVAQVQGKELVKSPAVELTNSLAGRLPGLVVIQTSGEPGNDGAAINIRGTNTFGNSDPLIVIDGVPEREGGLGRLSPQDIESISVLKDASAAIYGARAANGAIIITTKRGASGQANIRFDFNQGWAQPTKVPEMSDAVQYATIRNELNVYNGVTDASEWGAAWSALESSGTYTTSDDRTVNAVFPPDFFAAHAAGGDPWEYPDTDWFGDTFKNWSPQSRYNLQFDGGTDKLRYLVSLGYVDQDAIYENSATFYKQYNFRTNLDWEVNDYISANVGVVLRREDRNYPTESAGAIFRMLMRGRPNEPAIWPTGEPGPDIENGQNPVVITTNATGYDRQPTDYVQTNASITLSQPWVEGLSLTLSGAVDYKHGLRKRWQTPWELYFWDRISYQPDGRTPLLEGSIRSTFTDPRLQQSSETVLNTNMTAILNYSRSFGAHTVGGMIGVTREDFDGEFFSAYRRNFLSTALDQLFVGGLEQQQINGSAYERARLGTYGRLTYNYQETYLLEFIWRYDGSYIFPEDDRFGFFPGVLAGWNVTNEDFFNVPLVDYLKLRVSYGETGNDDVRFSPNGALQEYRFLATYDFGNFPINSAVASTLREGAVPNPNFTWERSRNFNIGFDATILGELDLTFEYFNNQRDQILLPNDGIIPLSSGIRQLPPENTGQLDNSGIEFALGYGGNINNTDGYWRVGVNGGYAKNEVVAINETRESLPEYQWQQGKPYQAWLVYRSDGAFRDQADIDANTLDYSSVYGTIQPGDMKFQDVNGDGVINADDQVRLDKNRTPTFNFGATFDLQWKNFDVSMLFQGATGALIRIQTESGDIGNFLEDHFDRRWSLDNPSSEFPRPASRGDTPYTGGNFGNNTFWLQSKDYIRLKNFEVGYTLPFEVSWMQSARIYVNGLNLFTIQNSENPFDPESNADNGVYYPQQRVINTGFSLTF